jgi:hypothetical protein
MDTEGYKVIAVRDDRLGTCVISYHLSKETFLLAINGKITGPFTEDELRACFENMKDVLDLRRNFLFIDEYDIYGNQCG